MTTPAKNYRPRVRRILDVMLGHIRVVAGPRYHQPSPQQMEHLIDSFHHVANWMLQGAARLGYDVTYVNGPLTEEQLRAFEQVFLNKR